MQNLLELRGEMTEEQMAAALEISRRIAAVIERLHAGDLDATTKMMGETLLNAHCWDLSSVIRVDGTLDELLYTGLYIARMERELGYVPVERVGDN